MVNKWNLLVMMLMCSATLSAQEKGIYFERGGGWEAIKEKAKESHRYIFVDCYTTWCGPCKMMMKNIFPQGKVGEFMNGNFVNLSVQMDTTAKDDNEVTQWYADAHAMAVNYHVDAYPTYLFFSPEGNIVHRAAGAFDSADAFLVVAAHAIDPMHQFYTLMDQYHQGKSNPDMIVGLVSAALEAGLEKDVVAVKDQYVASLKRPYSAADLVNIQRLTAKTSDKGYPILLQEMNDSTYLPGENPLKVTVMNILLQEEVYPMFNLDSVDWETVKQRITGKSNVLIADEMVAKSRVDYFSSKKQWPAYIKSLQYYASHYGKEIQPYLFNNYLWDVFEHCDDSTTLKEFLLWSMSTFTVHGEAFTGGMDTYANMLYKLGRTEEAIRWENKALQTAISAKSPEEETIIQETLNKMRHREKTWD
jgi:thioredoxin-related protein